MIQQLAFQMERAPPDKFRFKVIQPVLQLFIRCWYIDLLVEYDHVFSSLIILRLVVFFMKLLPARHRLSKPVKGRHGKGWVLITNAVKCLILSFLRLAPGMPPAAAWILPFLPCRLIRHIHPMALNVFVFFADSYISETFLLIFSESIFVDTQVILPLIVSFV